MTDASSEQKTRDDIVSENRARHVTVGMDNAQCPECGDQERITETKAKGRAQPVSPSRRAHCNECGHKDHPLAFHYERKFEEMSEQERQQVEKAHERAADRMADWEADGRP